MSAGFTPGPWSIWHDDCAYCAKQGDENWFVDGPTNTEHGGFAKAADAALIAAAPELYEALSIARERLQDVMAEGTMRIIDAALAKARGE